MNHILRKRIASIGFGIIIISIIGGAYGIHTTYVQGLYVKRDGIASSSTSLPSVSYENITVGQHAVQVEIVSSDAAILRGLSGRDSLAPDTGMLFTYQDVRMRTFWMKDMKFSIDIVWIRNGRIVGITNNAVPEPHLSDEMLRRYGSPEGVDMVLEVPAGWAREKGIETGMKVSW